MEATLTPEQWQQVMFILQAERARLLMVMFQVKGGALDRARERRDQLGDILAVLGRQHVFTEELC